jgi:phage gp36-like protein
MYCTAGEVVEMIKEDMQNAIIGDEYIEDPEERKARMLELSENAAKDACLEIDGYLSKRYTVPFRKTPGVLNKFAKDIAAYNLVSRMGVDESEREKTFLTRYNQAVSFLLNVAKGLIDIGVEGGAVKESAANGFRMESAERIFSRSSMKGW